MKVERNDGHASVPADNAVVPAGKAVIPEWGEQVAKCTLDEILALSGVVERDHPNKQFIVKTNDGQLVVSDKDMRTLHPAK